MFKKIKLILWLRKFWNWVTDQPWKEGLSMPENVTVPVKPISKSKIAWGAGIILLFGLLQFFGLDFSPEQQEQVKSTVEQIINGVTTVILPLLILIWRKWFNRTVTPE